MLLAVLIWLLAIGRRHRLSKKMFVRPSMVGDEEFFDNKGRLRAQMVELGDTVEETYYLTEKRKKTDPRFRRHWELQDEQDLLNYPKQKAEWERRNRGFFSRVLSDLFRALGILGLLELCWA